MAEQEKTQTDRDREMWQRWKAEVDFAQKDPRYKRWLEHSEKIVSRYRDERPDGEKGNRKKMNMLWSNVETLKPAIYPTAPKVIVERKFIDRDPAARLASTILERCMAIQMLAGYFHESMKQAVLDHLLPGMGQMWVRYEPVFEEEAEATDNAKEDAAERATTPEDIQDKGDGIPYERIAFERVCWDYVYYRDFLWGSARYWREVPWVSRRFWKTKTEIAELYYGGDMGKVVDINLDSAPEQRRSEAGQFLSTESYFKKVEIREVWNKADQTVYIFPVGTPDVMFKVEKKPVLALEGFWPCAEPMFTTQTNDTIVPVPDYAEYRDQAVAIDDLTNRIDCITTALRANGVYNSEYPELQRLLQEGMDNKLIPVESWAAFAEKGGIDGAISLVPIKEIIAVLQGLYEARQAAKQDLFEVTGMSDIMRGQDSGGGAKTATEQRIKGQFGSMRLKDRRDTVNRFALDNLRIGAEVVCEMFQPDTLMQMAGVDIMIQDEARKAAESVPRPQPPQQQQPPQQGGDPRMAQVAQMQAQAQAAAAQQQYKQAAVQAAQQAMQAKTQEFQKAIQILKSDKMRGFRIDIETNETIQADSAEEQQATDRLIQGTLAALTEAGPIIAQVPELLDPIGKLMMLGFRRHRVGRSVESSLEEALDRMRERLEAAKDQPPQPSPDEIKAKAQADAITQKTQADLAIKQADGQQKQADHQAQQQQDATKFMLEMKQMQAEQQAKAEQLAMDMQKMREEMAMERERMQLEREQMYTKAAVDAVGVQMDTQAKERQHELSLQTMEKKAAMAQKAPTK